MVLGPAKFLLPPHNEDTMQPRASEESIRTEDCEGPVPDTHMEDAGSSPAPGSGMASSSGSPAAMAGMSESQEVVCSDRAELIERLKRGESPTWAPNPSLQSEYLKANGEEIPLRLSPTRPLEPSTFLLPAAEIKRSTTPQKRSEDDLKSKGMEIQRPRSALHSGNFDEDAQRRAPKPFGTEIERSSACPGHAGVKSLEFYGLPPTTPWYSSSPPPSRSPHSPLSSIGGRTFSRNAFRERDYRAYEGDRMGRSSALSIGSYNSSNYVFKAPTTPLVHTSFNTDFDTAARDRSTSPEKTNRRHTLPPHALQGSNGLASPLQERDLNTPWQPLQRSSPLIRSHNPRRSWSNWSNLNARSPPYPNVSRSRRTSFSSEASPLQHASMVGSYEESILHGRMSTAPSRPLDFTAQIGVLGKGNCKPKCPPHATISFPAVYYSWTAGQGRRPDNDEPSPYVGQIDLQQRDTPITPITSTQEHDVFMSPDADLPLTREQEMTVQSPTPSSPKMKKRRRTSPSSKPPGGSYRIPEQGQLQIVIKNPNKTAVKLFLVPYDLTGMEPGTKTFIRQRLLSAGPILDSAMLSNPTARSTHHVDTPSKHTLRYLIHLNICSPSKGRFYLHQHIRVVFANRVPDNKEQLRTETQVPEPRFSVWKPTSLSRQPSSAGAKLTAEKAFRRRSSGFAAGMGYGEDIKAPWASSDANAFGSSGGVVTYPWLSSGLGSDAAPPVPPIPFSLPTWREKKMDRMDVDVDIEVGSSRPTTSSDLQSPENGKGMERDGNGLCRGCVPLSDLPNRMSSTDGIRGGDYGKLNRGDLGYGGLFGRPDTPELPGEGLLARKLRGLDVQRDQAGLSLGHNEEEEKGIGNL